MKQKIHFVGEILMRLSTIENKKNNGMQFQTYIGGAELNVASALSGLGHNTIMHSIIPTNFIGDYVEKWLLSRNISNNYVYNQEGNIGLYFLNSKPDDIAKTNVIYNRKNSVYVQNIEKILSFNDFNAGDIIHISGINNLLSNQVHNTILKLIKRVKQKKGYVSFDFNYRPQLSSKANAKKLFLEILNYVDFLFASKRDFIEILDYKEDLSENIFNKVMKNYNIKFIAHSNRDFLNKKHHYQSVIYMNNGQLAKSQLLPYEIKDRIGGGDTFAAGILDGIIKNKPINEIVEFSNKLAIYKQEKVYGDNVFISKEDLEREYAN